MLQCMQRTERMVNCQARQPERRQIDRESDRVCRTPTCKSGDGSQPQLLVWISEAKATMTRLSEAYSTRLASSCTVSKHIQAAPQT
jgi:hypothetical protein